MGILLAVTVLAGVVVAVDLAWWPPPPADVPERETPDAADVRNLEQGLLGEAAVRRRLDALAEELDRLDHDPAVFARAFHTRVARAAHEALLAAGIPEPAPARPAAPACVLDAFPGRWSGSSAEVLEL